MTKMMRFNKKLPPKEVDLLCSLGNGDYLFTAVFEEGYLLVQSVIYPDDWDVYLNDDEIKDKDFDETLEWMLLTDVVKLLGLDKGE